MSASMVCHEGRLYILGGVNNSSWVWSVEIFESEENKWKAVSVIPVDRFETSEEKQKNIFKACLARLCRVGEKLEPLWTSHYFIIFNFVVLSWFRNDPSGSIFTWIFFLVCNSQTKSIFFVHGPLFGLHIYIPVIYQWYFFTLSNLLQSNLLFKPRWWLMGGGHLQELRPYWVNILPH